MTQKQANQQLPPERQVYKPMPEPPAPKENFVTVLPTHLTGQKPGGQQT